MADVAFNIAKGRWVQWVIDDPTKIGVLLLKVAEADATLVDHDTVAAILAGANTEADFTNYARKTGITATPTLDDTNDRRDVDIPDQTWTSAGGAVNNTLVKLIIFYEQAAADATRIPIGAADFAETTDGNNLVATINAAGFARAA